MTRIAFCGDIHADQYGGRIDSGTGLNARLVDYLNTIRFVASDAVARGCVALSIGGDLTERKHVNTWLAGKIGEAFMAGPARQIFTRGNHDSEIGGESIVTVLARMQPHWQAFARPGVTVVEDVAVACIPHLDSKWLRAQPGMDAVPPHEINRILAEQYLVLARGLYAEAGNAIEGAGRMVLVIHQGLSGGAMSESQAAFLGDRSLVVDAAALAAIGWDAVIASHFHRAQELSTDPLVAYTGSIERVDFAEEHEDKSYLVLDIPRRGPITWERIETPARRYVTLRGTEVENALDLKWEPLFVDDAIVRAVDVEPHIDTAALREGLLQRGAFDVTEIRKQRVETESAAGMAEDLAPEAALDAYFADDPEAEALVARGREILEAVA